MRLRVNKYILTDKLITKDIKILSITDVHSNVKYLNKVLLKLKDISPDYIFFVGDTCDSINDSNNEELFYILKNIADKYNTFICLGNHDLLQFSKRGFNSEYEYIDDLSFFEKLKNNTKMHVLIDDNYQDEFVQVISFNVGDEWYHKCREDKSMFKDLFKKFINGENILEDKFTILLLHSPNGIIENNEINIDKTNINLILCGHNHGGITFKFIQKFSKKHRGFILPHKMLFAPGAYGIYNKGDTSVLLSSGLTKFGSSHLNKFLGIFGNNIFGSDIEFVTLKNGKHNLSNK